MKKSSFQQSQLRLTHWGPVMPQQWWGIMDFVNAGFGSGLLPAWCQAITKTNDDFLSIDLARTISIGILHICFFQEENGSHFWRPQCASSVQDCGISNELVKWYLSLEHNCHASHLYTNEGMCFWHWNLRSFHAATWAGTPQHLSTIVLNYWKKFTTHSGLGDFNMFNEILDEYFSSQLQWLMTGLPAVKLPSMKNVIRPYWW